MNNRTDKKQDWRSSDSDLKSGTANTNKSADVSTPSRTSKQSDIDSSASKSASTDTPKNRDQRR